MLAIALIALAAVAAATPIVDVSAKVDAITAIYNPYLTSNFASVPTACSVVNAGNPNRYLCKTTIDPLYMNWRETQETYKQLLAKYPGRLQGFSWTADNKLTGDWALVANADAWTFEFGDECVRHGKPGGHKCLVVHVKNAFE
jgi:hypothetical protein